MDINAAYREVGSYRAAAEICGMTPKTVKRAVLAEQVGPVESVHNYDDVRDEPPLASLEAPDLGRQDGAMPTQGASGKPTTRRYSDEEKAQAVRLARQLRAELGTGHGTIKRVAEQLGYGVESVRGWVKQAEIDDGVKPGVTTAEAERDQAP